MLEHILNQAKTWGLRGLAATTILLPYAAQAQTAEEPVDSVPALDISAATETRITALEPEHPNFQRYRVGVASDSWNVRVTHDAFATDADILEVKANKDLGSLSLTGILYQTENLDKDGTTLFQGNVGIGPILIGGGRAIRSTPETLFSEGVWGLASVTHGDMSATGVVFDEADADTPNLFVKLAKGSETLYAAVGHVGDITAGSYGAFVGALGEELGTLSFALYEPSTGDFTIASRVGIGEPTFSRGQWDYVSGLVFTPPFQADRAPHQSTVGNFGIEGFARRDNEDREETYQVLGVRRVGDIGYGIGLRWNREGDEKQWSMPLTADTRTEFWNVEAKAEATYNVGENTGEIYIRIRSRE